MGEYSQSAEKVATTFVVIGYALCSSLLAVINKYAITEFPYPALLTSLQYATSAGGVAFLGFAGVLQHDALTYKTAVRFLPAALVFHLAIFTNTNLLRHANVDTFIVFRSCTPLLVSFADTAFRGQPPPPGLARGALFLIFASALGYVFTDSTFTVTAYSWAFAYLITITTEMVYIKHTVMNLGLNTWGFVLYNNTLSLIMSPLFWLPTGEYSQVWQAFLRHSGSSSNSYDWEAVVAISISCLFGLAISFFGFAARKRISATSFTVTGVLNKFLTVLINVAIWDKHATNTGLLCLLVTMLGGLLYQQSTTTTSAPQLVKKSPDLDLNLVAVEVQEEEGERLLPSSAPDHNKC